MVTPRVFPKVTELNVDNTPSPIPDHYEIKQDV